MGALVSCGSRTPLSDASSSASPHTPFPFTGPSCASNDACWQCIEDSCGSAVDCIATDCSAEFTHVCACLPGDWHCIGNLQPAAGSCESCTASLSSCAAPGCQAACDGTVSGDRADCPSSFTAPTSNTCVQGLVESAGSIGFFWAAPGGGPIEARCPCTDLGPCLAFALASCEGGQ